MVLAAQMKHSYNWGHRAYQSCRRVGIHSQGGDALFAVQSKKEMPRDIRRRHRKQNENLRRQSNRHTPIQLLSEADMTDLANDMKQILHRAPTKGCNLWRMRLPKGGELFLLGTSHASHPYNLHELSSLLDFFGANQFGFVFNEVATEACRFPVANDEIEEAANLLMDKMKLEAGDKSIKKVDVYRRLKKMSAEAEKAASTGNDEAFARLALKGKSGAMTMGLEDKEKRALANRINATQNGQTVLGKEIRSSPEDTFLITEAVIRGRETLVWEKQIEALESGRDIQDVEQRNSMWVDKQRGLLGRYDVPNRPILWIVGASHIPGLILRLEKIFGRCTFESVGGLREENPTPLPPFPNNTISLEL